VPVDDPETPVTDPSATVDVHAHIGRTVAMGIAHTYPEYVETMRAAGISRAILSPMAGGRQADGVRDTMRDNDAIAEAMRADPTRFPVGLAAVEVRHEEQALAELERCFVALGLQGLAFHAIFSGFSVGVGDALDPLLDLANDRGALCLMHAMPEAGRFSMESPKAIGELAARYPDVVFIMGHSAITEDQRAVSIEAAIGRDNLHVDLAYQDDPRTVETFVRTLGAERVLFGSDAPFCDPRATIRSVHAAQISDREKELILHGNATELLSRFS
jgi:predicted TIM-barrel fold metal-dependent hydrolase